MRILAAAVAMIWCAGAASAAAEDLTHCQTAQKAMEKDAATARTEFKACLAKGQLAPLNAAVTHMNLAVIAFSAKKFPEVISEYDLAAKAFVAGGKPLKPDALTLYNRGVAYAETGQAKKARADLDGALKLAPKQMPIVVTHMGLLAAMGDINGALADSATLVAQPENNWKVIGHARRVALFEAAKKYPEALAETEEVLKLEPNNLDVLLSRVGILHAMGKTDQILIDTEKLVQSGKPMLEFSARTIRGSIFDEQGKFDDALAEADAAIKINAKEPVGHNNRCMALANLGRTDEAVASCQKAMEIAPKSTMVWNSMGFALEKGGKLKEAMTYYQKVAAVQPKNSGNNADLKRVQLALGVTPTAPPVAAAAKPAVSAAKPKSRRPPI